jgi:hypothetical protein
MEGWFQAAIVSATVFVAPPPYERHRTFDLPDEDEGRPEPLVWTEFRPSAEPGIAGPASSSAGKPVGRRRTTLHDH